MVQVYTWSFIQRSPGYLAWIRIHSSDVVSRLPIKLVLEEILWKYTLRDIEIHAMTAKKKSNMCKQVRKIYEKTTVKAQNVVDLTLISDFTLRSRGVEIDT